MKPIRSIKQWPKRDAKPQFSIATLLFVTALTAFCLSIASLLEGWLVTPLVFITGLLIWNNRRTRYATVPGWCIGALSGFAIVGFPRSDDPRHLQGWLFVLMICAVTGASINAMVRGNPYSGLFALLAMMLFFVAAPLLLFITY